MDGSRALISRALFFSLMLSFAIGGCNSKSGGNGSTTGSIRVSWEANHEDAVNSAGGGYKVWVSQESNFSTNGLTPTKILDYSAGTHGTSVDLRDYDSGTWYVRVQAYTATSESDISDATAVQVP